MSTRRLFAPALALALALGASRAHASPETWRRSYTLEGQGNVRGALEALDTLPDTDRHGYLYALRRGWLLYLAGRHAEAVGAYQSAVTASPDALEARLGELLPLMALRRWQDAEALAREVLRVDPNNYLASRRLALVLYNLGRFPAAEQVYRQVLTRYPGDLEMLSGVGWCELRQGHRTEATEAFHSVLAVSDDATARSGVAAVAAP